jgi:hypothetical protein
MLHLIAAIAPALLNPLAAFAKTDINVGAIKVGVNMIDGPMGERVGGSFETIEQE